METVHPLTSLRKQPEQRDLLPDPSATEMELARYHHQDLRTLDFEALWAEEILTKIALATEIFQRRRAKRRIANLEGEYVLAEVWLRGRRSAIAEELARRSRRRTGDAA